MKLMQDESSNPKDVGRRTVLAGIGAGVGLSVAASCAGAQVAAAQASGQRNKRNTRPLAGKAASVTGARNNLGRGFAIALAEMGANVVIHQHREQTRAEAEETARLCQEHHVKTAIFTADLVPVANVRAMYDVAFEHFDRVDIVVNSAGRIKKQPLAEITEHEFDLCDGINNKAMFFSMQQAARRMSDGGRIINIGTSLLNATTPFYSAYAGTKAPIEEYTRMLAREVGDRRITVNVVAPGAVDTPFFHAQETPESVRYVENATPAKRLGNVSDIVPVVAFLAAPDSQWITGQTIWVNDGYSTR